MNAFRSILIGGLMPLLLICAATPSPADSLATLEGYPYQIHGARGLDYADPEGNEQQEAVPARIRWIVYPTTGCPSIVEPGGELFVVVRLDDGGILEQPHLWQVALVTRSADPADDRAVGDPVSQRYRTRVTETSYDPERGLYLLRAKVSPGTPTDTYALMVGSTGFGDVQPAAVSVQRGIDSVFRFVVLSDPMIGREPGGLDPDPAFNNGLYPHRDEADPQIGALAQAAAEISLLRPAFVVLTGDLTAGTDAAGQYTAFAEVMRESGAPVFKVPGDRDGAADLDDSGRVIFDGLNSFRRIIGPSYYSFDYGPVHVICLNTYDGTPVRRQVSPGIGGAEAINGGGFLSEEQLVWLELDLKAATEAKKEIYVFAHHDPRGPYAPNEPPGGPLLFAREQAWNYESGAWDSNPFDGIFHETERYNTGIRALRMIAASRVSLVMLGSRRTDRVEGFIAGEEITDFDGRPLGVPATRPIRFVHTTTVSGDPGTKADYWGYRVVEVLGGPIHRLRLSDEYDLGSWPLGNFWIEEFCNDGSCSEGFLTGVNALPEPVQITSLFRMAPGESGYEAFERESGEPVRFKDVGIGEQGQILLYATLNLEAGSSYTEFPPEPYAESRPAFLIGPSGSNAPPTARFRVTDDPEDPMARWFDARDSVDEQGYGTLWRMDWDFGDGTGWSGQVASHRYAVPGIYEITLALTDDAGARTTAAKRIEVGADEEEDEDGGCGIYADGEHSGAWFWTPLALALLVLILRPPLRFRRNRRQGVYNGGGD